MINKRGKKKKKKFENIHKEVSRWIPRNPHQKEKQLHQTKLEEELKHQIDHLSMAPL
jgi:hypothetical protein